MKKAFRKAVVTAAMAVSVAACPVMGTFAAQVPANLVVSEADPDFSKMTTDEWTAYEFHEDYATVISDVTSYSHKDLRSLLDTHWSHYIELTSPDNGMSEKEKAEYLTEWHNAREAITPISDPVSKRIYLWPDTVPTVTSYTENTDYKYADDPDFRPYMMTMLTTSAEIKGAVVLAAGGGHMYRSNVEETYEVALALNNLGYDCFIVNYRIDPYTDDESALDIERAIRIVRASAPAYGYAPDHIAAAGFSYGGIVTSLAADKYYGDINASALVPGYQPDAVDAVDGTMNAYLAIYSVTPDQITNPDFPDTFFAVGNDDGVRQWALRCFDMENELKINNEFHIFAGVPHGFGAGVHADGTLYSNAATWPQLADQFMQDVYAKADAAQK